MALPARCGQRMVSSLLRQRCLAETRIPTSLRSFSTQIPSRTTSFRPQTQKFLSLCRQSRSFSSGVLLRGQDSPSTKAYLASGAVQEGKNLVDVKKVLVIGSGGLSIGQAGEFDYSGMFWLGLYSIPLTAWCQLSHLFLKKYQLLAGISATGDLLLLRELLFFMATETGIMTDALLTGRSRHRLASIEGFERSRCPFRPDQP
jgi:hypothetical protein